MPTKQEFKSEIIKQLRNAELSGAKSIAITSGELHRKLGGYPDTTHQMPSCCDAMYDEQKPGDEVVQSPPKGKGATLTIRYKLPR